MIEENLFTQKTLAAVSQQFAELSQTELQALLEQLDYSVASWCNHQQSILHRYFAKADQKTVIRVLDIGAGTSFLPLYCIFKQVFPGASIQYYCVDPDPAGALMLKRSAYQGSEIRYLIGSATDKTLLLKHGIGIGSIDIALSLYPVMLPPLNTGRMTERGRLSLQSQHEDFKQIFTEVLPKIINKSGCFLGMTYDREELGQLQSYLAKNLPELSQCTLSRPKRPVPQIKLSCC